jgi:hypothetical protein
LVGLGQESKAFEGSKIVFIQGFEKVSFLLDDGQPQTIGIG